VVQLAAAPHRQPVDLLLPRGDFDRCRAVVSGEVVLVGEAAHVPSEADGYCCYYWPDAEDLGRGCPRRSDDGRQALLQLGQLGVQADEVPQQLFGELLACRGDSAQGSKASSSRATLLAYISPT